MKPMNECVIANKKHRLVTKSVSRVRAVRNSGVGKKGLCYYVVPFNTNKGKVYGVYVSIEDLDKESDLDKEGIPDTLFPNDNKMFRTSNELVEHYIDNSLL